jgi:Protein of unknown function (DUF2786)
VPIFGYSGQSSDQPGKREYDIFGATWCNPRIFVLPLGQTAGVAKTRNQQRADKKRRASQARKSAVRQHDQTLWPNGDGSGSSTPGGCAPRQTPGEIAELAEHIELLVGSGLTLSNAGSEFREHFDSIVDRLVDLDGVLAAGSNSAPPGTSSLRPEALLSKRLLTRIPLLWECGWQPLDLVHVVRKERNPRISRLAGVLIHAESVGFPGFACMPDEWGDQLAAIPNVMDSEASAQAPLSVWRFDEDLSMADSLHDALLLLGLLQVLPRLTVLCVPPSKWSSSAGSGGSAGSGESARSTPNTSESVGAGTSQPAASAKNMSTIRALLAKAEATTFEAEREVFAAKAQDLMTRYSIDAAFLDQRHGEQLGAGVRKRRFHLDNPYATEKVYLLSTVARLNNVKIVYEDRFAMATAVGFPTDIELTDLLFTSLLVQAAKGLQDLVTAAGKGRTSSPAFRRAYWVAYGVRIGERLTEAQSQATQEAEETYGGALVLVLKEREEAVDAVTDELFKNTKKMKVRQLDSDGWDAGRAAAGNANLGTAKARLRT